MIRLSVVLVVVTCMAIWPFSNSANARDDDAPSALNARVDALERKIERLEDKIGRLEARAGNAEPGTDGVRPGTEGVEPEQRGRVGGMGACPGEWRQIGGGWTCADPNAK